MEPDPEASSESSLNSMRPAASREMFEAEEAERAALDALLRLHCDLTLGGGLIHEQADRLHLARAYGSARVQACIRNLILWQATLQRQTLETFGGRSTTVAMVACALRGGTTSSAATNANWELC